MAKQIDPSILSAFWGNRDQDGDSKETSEKEGK